MLDYVSREGSLEAIGRWSDKLTPEDQKQELEQWISFFTSEAKYGQHRKNSRNVMHYAVSAPAESKKEDFKKAVAEFAKDNFQENDYMVFFHEDTKQPHAHFLIRTLN